MSGATLQHCRCLEDSASPDATHSDLDAVVAKDQARLGRLAEAFFEPRRQRPTCGHGRTAELGGDLAHRHAAAEHPCAAAERVDVPWQTVKFILQFAHHLFDQVFERDQSQALAVGVAHDGHVLVLVDEGLEQVGGGTVGVDEVDRADDALQARIARIRAHEVDQFLEVDVSDDAIAVIALADREACVSVDVGRDHRLVQRLRCRKHRYLLDGDHDLPRAGLGQLRRAADDPLLVRSDVLGESRHHRQRGDLFQRGWCSFLGTPPLERSVEHVQHVNHRGEDSDGHEQRPGDPYRNRLVEVHAQGLGQNLGVLEHGKCEQQREQPNPLVAEYLIKLGTGD